MRGGWYARVPTIPRIIHNQNKGIAKPCNTIAIKNATNQLRFYFAYTPFADTPFPIYANSTTVRSVKQCQFAISPRLYRSRVRTSAR